MEGIQWNQAIRVSANLPMFAESLPSSTDPYKTQLTKHFWDVVYCIFSLIVLTV